MSEQAPVKKKRRAIFPYADMDEAMKDKFDKIGGKIGAFRAMQKGWKTVIWRKRAEKNVKEKEDAHEAALAAAEKKEAEGKKKS